MNYAWIHFRSNSQMDLSTQIQWFSIKTTLWVLKSQLWKVNHSITVDRLISITVGASDHWVVDLCDQLVAGLCDHLVAGLWASPIPDWSISCIVFNLYFENCDPEEQTVRNSQVQTINDHWLVNHRSFEIFVENNFIFLY